MIEKPNYTTKQIDLLLSKMKIVIDTREQVNYHITDYFDAKLVDYVSQKLDYGDYSLCIPAHPELGIEEDIYFTDKIVIERKNSLMEISNNLGNERERFERELARSKGSTFIIMIEDGCYEDILFERYSKDRYAIKSNFNPKAFIATLATFRARYGIHVDYVNKKSAGNFIYHILKYWLRCYLKGELQHDAVRVSDLSESS